MDCRRLVKCVVACILIVNCYAQDTSNDTDQKTKGKSNSTIPKSIARCMPGHKMGRNKSFESGVFFSWKSQYDNNDPCEPCKKPGGCINPVPPDQRENSPQQLTTTPLESFDNQPPPHGDYPWMKGPPQNLQMPGGFSPQQQWTTENPPQGLTENPPQGPTDYPPQGITAYQLQGPTDYQTQGQMNYQSQQKWQGPPDYQPQQQASTGYMPQQKWQGPPDYAPQQQASTSYTPQQQWQRPPDYPQQQQASSGYQWHVQNVYPPQKVYQPQQQAQTGYPPQQLWSRVAVPIHYPQVQQGPIGYPKGPNGPPEYPPAQQMQSYRTRHQF